MNSKQPKRFELVSQNKQIKKKPNVLGCQKRMKIVKLKKSLTQPILLKVSYIFTLLQILGGYVNSLKSFLSLEIQIQQIY